MCRGCTHQTGGGDTPSGPHASTSVAQHDADMSYPAGSADDEATVNSFISQNLIQCLRRGYAEEMVSLDMPNYPQLYQDANGLYWTDTHQLVVPKYEGRRFEMFESVHCHPFSGHWGLSRTQKKAMQLYFWPRLATDIKEWCQKCDSCQRVKAERAKPKGALRPLDIPER